MTVKKMNKVAIVIVIVTPVMLIAKAGRNLRSASSPSNNITGKYLTNYKI